MGKKKKTLMNGIIKVSIITFLLSLIIIMIYGYFVVFNSSDAEVNCEQGVTNTGYSNGNWISDNPILFLFSEANTNYNCECGIFGVTSEDPETKLPECIYYDVNYINNKDACITAGKEYIEFNSGGKAEGICVCKGNADQERGVVCLPRDTWEDYNSNIKNEILNMILPWIYLYLIIFVFVLIIVLLIRRIFK